MDGYTLLFTAANYSPKIEVKPEEEEQEEKVEIKLEPEPDMDDKLDVSTPLILDLVALKNESYCSNLSLKEEITLTDDLVKSRIKLETEPDMDDKLDVSTPLILDLVALKSESYNSNISMKEEVTLTDDLVKSRIKLETEPDIDSKFDVSTPLLLDLVALKSESYNSNISMKEEVTLTDDLVKSRIKLETEPDMDDKLDVSTPLILDLVALKSESCHSNISLKEEVTLKDYLFKEGYLSGDDIDTNDAKEIEEFNTLSGEEGYLLFPIAIKNHEEDHNGASITNKKRNVYNRETQLTKTAKKKYIRERKFVCHHCGKKFTQGDVLRQHIRIHTGERPFTCNFCHKTFRTKNLLKNHVQLHTGKRFKCDYCNKEFQQNHQLKCHLLIHTGNKPVFMCDVCKKIFSSKFRLKTHISEIHLGQTRKRVRYNCSKRHVKCNECNKEISCKRNLILHSKRLHQTTKEAFNCAHCNKSFTEKLLLRFHISNTHLDSKPMICQYCKKTFKNDFYLQIHVKNHHLDDKSTQYFCEICQKGFRKVAYLKRHKQTHTNEDKHFICDTCGQRCRSKTDMLYHVMTHMKKVPKPFECDKCDMSFVKSTKLKRHQLVHSNIKPYKCHHCDKAYKDKSSLKIHENTAHLNASFTCDTCGFHSINGQSFKRHLRNNLCSKKLLKKLKEERN